MEGKGWVPFQWYKMRLGKDQASETSLISLAQSFDYIAIHTTANESMREDVEEL